MLQSFPQVLPFPEEQITAFKNIVFLLSVAAIQPNRIIVATTMYYIRNIKLLKNLLMLYLMPTEHEYCIVVYIRFLVHPRMPVTRNYHPKAS